MKKNNLSVFLLSSCLSSVLLLAACSPQESSNTAEVEPKTQKESIVEETIEGLVKTPAEFNDAIKSAKPGDTVVLANGVWQDFEIAFKAEGTEKEPIKLTAQTKGEVILSGKSSLKLGGKYLEVSGLVFKDGYSPTGEVISYRIDKETLAYHSRVTEVVIDNFNNPERFEADFWVMMYGKHNRFDHSHLVGKRNVGVTMAVRLDQEESRENYHQIDHNYFGPRPNLGSNGGETLRIGTSHYSLSNSFTTIENNYFDRCNGELEIISNKSGSNIIRGNVFFESRGTLTLRHGNDNVVENNILIGGGLDHTGGIRLINARQTIKNNYMEALAGYRFGGGLVVMNGVPNSPINRYHQVKDSFVENNSIINVDHIQLGAGSDPERSAIPENTSFKNNAIFHEGNKDTFTIYDDMSGINFSNNITNERSSFKIKEGFEHKSFTMSRAANGLLYPDDPSLAAIGVSKDLKPITKNDVGASWYEKREPEVEFGSGQTFQTGGTGQNIIDVINNAKAGDIITIAPGDYNFDKTIDLSKPITLKAAVDGEVKLNIQRPTLFNLLNGGSIKLSGMTISGADAPDNGGNAVFRTARKSMLNNYRLWIENSQFIDMDVNHSFNILSAAKGTMADSIVINNSKFKDISGSILKLDAETDNYGIYNAEYVTITSSQFENIGGAIADYYRGGTDESTFGPHFLMADSDIKNVGFGKKNWNKTSLYLHGVQVTTVASNRFEGSQPFLINHTVGEPVTKFIKNDFIDTKIPTINELNSVKEDTATFIENSYTQGAM